MIRYQTLRLTDSALGDELKGLCEEVQMNCIDFRTNVFMKNVDHLDEKFVRIIIYSIGNIR